MFIDCVGCVGVCVCVFRRKGKRRKAWDGERDRQTERKRNEKQGEERIRKKKRSTLEWNTRDL